MNTPNFITFDIEEWFHVNYQGITIPKGEKGNVEPLTNRLLDVCDEAGIKCTYFVLGTVAEQHPNLVRRIHGRGHEVASHSYSHESLRNMTQADFLADTRRSLNVLEDAIGNRVLGYRAPSFSVTAENAGWYYDTLAELNFVYSSSVFPGKTFLYGIPDFPRVPHFPKLGGTNRILEFPISRVDILHLTLPLYLRLFPAALLARIIRQRSSAGQPSMLYLHPREIDPGQPRLPLGGFAGFVHYWGIDGCEKNLRKLMRQSTSFCCIKEAVDAFA